MRVSSFSSTIAIAILSLTALAGCSASGPAPLHPHASPGATACQPANGRQGQPGCWIVATARLSASSAPLYWHVYEIESAEQARQSVGAPGSIVRAQGRTWLMAVAGQEWRARAGRHVASVGPMHLLSMVPHTASFMEATFTPGMASRIHTHPGPEAWVILEGEQCLESSEGVIRGGAGDAMMVRGGIPMQLFGTGAEVRKALVLILHPTGQPPAATDYQWQPAGACLAN